MIVALIKQQPDIIPKLMAALPVPSLLNPKLAMPATRAIKRFNNHIYNDSRVEISMLPIGDGLTLARKL